jgi:hypothetical protein
MMTLRSVLLRLIAAITIIGIYSAAFVAIAVPTETAEACNPCDCPEDRRINCQGIQFYGIYTYERGSICYIDAYRMEDNGSPGRRAWRITSRDLADLPEFPEENMLITQEDAIFFYKLTSGEYQVNAGPAPDGKIYVLIFENACVAENRRELSFIPGE